MRHFNILTIFTLIALNIANGAEFEKILSKEFDLPNLSKAVLEVDSGDVTLVKSTTGRVEVVVKMKTSTGNQEKADTIFANSQVEFLTPGNGVAKTVVKSNKSGWDWIRFWKKFPSIEVELRAPEGITLGIVTGSGDVHGENLAVELKLVTGAGDVNLNNIKGIMNIATGAGDIELNRVEGKLSAATGAGDLDANGSFSQFSISTGAGDVNLMVDNPVAANSSISTGAGSIQISLPVGSSFDLGADVGFGDINCQFDILDTNPEKKSFRGIYNEGSTRIRLSTGFGDVFIGRR